MDLKSTDIQHIALPQDLPLDAVNTSKIHSKQEKDNDTATFIKLSNRILSYIRELEVKIDLLEIQIAQQTNNASSSNTQQAFEPIRGINGLAKFLGVSPVTAQKLKNSGKIPYSQFDRVILFDPGKVMDALEVNSQPKKRKL